MSILKNGERDHARRRRSAIREMLPATLARLPKELQGHRSLFDQSVFVRAAVDGVVKEALIAAGLTGADDPALPRELAEHADRRRSRSRCRSWCRSSCSRALGQTLNVMTLGGHGARGRHPRRRRDGRDREHPPQHGAAEAVRARDPRRRAADRGAGVRVDALHLHRVRAGRRSSPARRSRCSCRWRWRSCSRC